MWLCKGCSWSVNKKVNIDSKYKHVYTIYYNFTFMFIPCILNNILFIIYQNMHK